MSPIRVRAADRVYHGYGYVTNDNRRVYRGSRAPATHACRSATYLWSMTAIP